MGCGPSAPAPAVSSASTAPGAPGLPVAGGSAGAGSKPATASGANPTSVSPSAAAGQAGDKGRDAGDPVPVAQTPAHAARTPASPEPHGALPLITSVTTPIVVLPPPEPGTIEGGVPDGHTMPPPEESPPADEAQTVVAAAARKGVTAVLALMKEQASDNEYQWWCCDALAGLCAGNAEARAAVFANNGIPMVLSAMRLFSWDENVQVKACWLLAILAANYAEHLGKGGVVETVVDGMRALSDSYQVQISGTRCLQNLITGWEPNRAKAKAAGAEVLLGEVLEKNPEDGQLQYRGAALLEKLHSLTEADMKALMAGGAAAGGAGSRGVGWNKLKGAVTSGHAKRIATGNIPGFHGVSAQVAERARKGIVDVVELMKERPNSSEVAKWCCDAIATMIYSSPEAREQAHAAGALPLIVRRIREHTWDEELILKACWALLAFAPVYAAEIGQLGAIGALAVAMYRSKTNHDVQVSAVKLLSLLTLEPTKVNLRLAREANAARIVKNVISAHVEDGQLQYRGINLLERLEPGCTASMPKINLIRSASMRAEEMVFQTRSMARMHSSRSTPATSRHATPEEEARVNAAAIAEVDEAAHQVEDDEGSTDEEGDSGRHRGHRTGAGATARSRGGAGAGGAGGSGGGVHDTAATTTTTTTATGSTVAAVGAEDGGGGGEGGVVATGGGGGGKESEEDAVVSSVLAGSGGGSGRGGSFPPLPGSVDSPCRHDDVVASARGTDAAAAPPRGVAPTPSPRGGQVHTGGGGLGDGSSSTSGLPQGLDGALAVSAIDPVTIT